MIRNRNIEKQVRKIVAAFLASTLLWYPLFSPATAQEINELRTALNQIQSRREDLEAQRLAHERDSRNLQSQLRDTEIEFRDCRSGRWRVAWNDRVQEVEQARRNLEQENTGLIDLNQSLRLKNNELRENRLAIERRRPEDFSRYSDEFRGWLNRVENEYLWRLENELFAGYNDYHHGMNNYIDLVNNLAAACRNNDYGPAIVEKFETHLADILAFATAILARR